MHRRHLLWRSSTYGCSVDWIGRCGIYPRRSLKDRQLLEAFERIPGVCEKVLQESALVTDLIVRCLREPQRIEVNFPGEDGVDKPRAKSSKPQNVQLRDSESLFDTILKLWRHA